MSADSAGVLALSANSNHDLDFSGLPNVGLGAAVSYSHTGTITPANNTYRLGGGGGGVLFLQNRSALTDAGGARNVAVGPHGSSGATVVLSDANDYSGATTLRGGTLDFQSDYSGSVAQGVNSLIVDRGHSAVNFGPVSANSGLTVNSLTRTAGATVAFSGSPNTTNRQIVLPFAPPLGPWAFYNTTDFAAYDATLTGNVVAAATAPNARASNDSTTWLATDSVSISGSLSLNGSRNVRTLRSTAAAATVTSADRTPSSCSPAPRRWTAR